MTERTDIQLADEITYAIRELDAADAAKKEKAIIAGRLLAEAQKRHPSDKAFEKFLLLAGGVQLRRAQDLIAIALGRKDHGKHQADHAAAQQRLRDKHKAEKLEREKAEPEPEPDASRDASSEPEPDASRKTPMSTSLRLFEIACTTYLPLLNETDLQKARQFVLLDKWRSKTKRVA